MTVLYRFYRTSVAVIILVSTSKTTDLRYFRTTNILYGHCYFCEHFNGAFDVSHWQVTHSDIDIIRPNRDDCQDNINMNKS